MIEVTEVSIAQLRAALESGQTTSVELVQAYLARIDAYVSKAEDRAAACTCREPEAFNPFRRETRLDYSLKLARFKRMAAEEGRA